MVNVGVAWGCALAVDVFDTVPSRAADAEAYDFWEVMRWDRFGSTSVVSARNRNSFVSSEVFESELPPSELVPDWSGLQPPTVTNAETFSDIRLVDARGWPCRSFGVRSAAAVTPRVAAVSRRPAVPFERHGKRAFGCSFRSTDCCRFVQLPLGFAVNTGLYGLALFLTTFSSRLIRHHVRLRRGLCPKCKYVIGASPICTECGTELPPRRVRA